MYIENLRILEIFKFKNLKFILKKSLKIEK